MWNEINLTGDGGYLINEEKIKELKEGMNVDLHQEGKIRNKKLQKNRNCH